MVLVTLVGENLAKVGLEFIYTGPLFECRDCKLKTVCFNLDEGRKYRVIGVRAIRHDCKIHDEGVRVVEIEKIPLRIIVKSDVAVEGSTIEYNIMRCENFDCQYYNVCILPNLKVGEKLKIVKICENISCPKGDKLTIVEIE